MVQQKLDFNEIFVLFSWIYLAYGISKPYGLFDAEISLFYKCATAIMYIDIFNVPSQSFFKNHTRFNWQKKNYLFALLHCINYSGPPLCTSASQPQVVPNAASALTWLLLQLDDRDWQWLLCIYNFITPTRFVFFFFLVCYPRDLLTPTPRLFSDNHFVYTVGTSRLRNPDWRLCQRSIC